MRKSAQSALFEWLSRAGFVARGVIYGIIGILALQLALGAGGKATNQQGALRTIAQQPFGKLLLILVAIGLGGYAVVAASFARRSVTALRAVTAVSTAWRRSRVGSSTPGCA